jgi:hypothetical protein
MENNNKKPAALPESRKKRNLEIERIKKQKQRIFTAVLSVFIGLVIVALGYAIWDIQNRRTIMTFEGTRIATSDFRFFNALHLMHLGSADRDMVFNHLLETLVILDQAERDGLGATPPELAVLSHEAREIREQASQQLPGGMNFISEQRVSELLSTNTVFERLMDRHLPDTEIDEDEFAEMLEERMEDIYAHASELLVRYIASHDPDLLQEIKDSFAPDYSEFDMLIRSYCIYHTEDGGIEPVEISEFFVAHGTVQHWPELTALEVGEISEVIEADGVFFLVEMYERIVDQDIIEETKEILRNDMINARRSEAFMELVEQWTAAANYTINERAFNRF